MTPFLFGPIVDAASANAVAIWNKRHWVVAMGEARCNRLWWADGLYIVATSKSRLQQTVREATEGPIETWYALEAKECRAISHTGSTRRGQTCGTGDAHGARKANHSHVQGTVKPISAWLFNRPTRIGMEAPLRSKVKPLGTQGNTH